MGSRPRPRPPSRRGSGAPGQSCRVSQPATTDPSQTPQETQSRTGPMRPPGPQPSHALPAARGRQGRRLTGSRLGGHHRGLEPSQHSGPFSESGPGKTTPDRDRPAPGPPLGGDLPPGGVLHRSPTTQPLPGPHGPLSQLWGLSHARQPGYPSPQRDPQKPEPTVGQGRVDPTFTGVPTYLRPPSPPGLPPGGSGAPLMAGLSAALTELPS